MYNFFALENSKKDNCFLITGKDYNHIVNVLRMKKDEEFLVSYDGKSHLCKLKTVDSECVYAEIIKEDWKNTDLPIEIYLFQGLPKSDKMELIIQKAVELGVSCVVPVEMNRCVVKLEEKKKKTKISRWQAIAESAAKQSKRSVIPKVEDVLSFENMLKASKEMDILLVPYENKAGMESTKKALSSIKKGFKVGILIGPEGGFEEKEIEKALSLGGKTISLGSRILRTETAAITAVGMCMLYAETELEK